MLLDKSRATGNFVSESEMASYGEKLSSIKKTMQKKESMLDWLDKDTTVSEQDLLAIKHLAQKMAGSVLIVIGVGGSFLGAKALTDAFSGYFLKSNNRVQFAGFNMSAEYLKDLLDFMDNHDCFVNFVSKSGGTLEPNLALSAITAKMQEKYGNSYERIIISSSSEKMRQVAKNQGSAFLHIPENIGGRYSLFSVAGLLPLAHFGCDIDLLLSQVKLDDDVFQMAADYACIRDILYKKGKRVEAVTFYEGKLEYLAKWYQQLFAETQGKNKEGVLPIVNANTTNLHSLGQFLQDGYPQTFETVLSYKSKTDIVASNISLNHANDVALNMVAKAHLEGDCPSIIWELGSLNEKSLGKFCYTMMLSAAVGSYLLNQYPFDQPGVELYKKFLLESL